MRRSKEDTAATRRSIVGTASVEFRRSGIAETALSDIMASVGLTHGGFYRHFDSKDQLAAEAFASAIGSVVDRMAAAASRAPAGEGFDAIIESYLSGSHRDRPATGCPLGALGAEIARGDGATRHAATAGLDHFVDVLAAQLPEPQAPETRDRALGAVSTMVGSLILSRMVDDLDLSEGILRQARRRILG